MGMRNEMSPYGGVNPLIDKMIGNAYDIVKYVARYLKEIRYVAENMEYVYTAANGNRTVLNGVATSTTLSIPLPVGMITAKLEAVTVIATGSSGTLFFPAPNTFSFSIIGGNVVVAIAVTFPELATAMYRVTLTSDPNA